MLYGDEQDPTRTVEMRPAFPKHLYPLQNCDMYGCIPHTIPMYTSTGQNAKNTSMLWILSGMLIRVQELWQHIYNMSLYQSNWHGWLLTYLAKTTFSHWEKRQTTKGDPFSMTLMNSVTKIMDRMVSILSKFKLIMYCNFH